MAFVGGFLGDQHLMFMRSYDAHGISWSLTPTELTPSGDYAINSSSLRTVRGRPAIVFTHRSEGWVGYLRAVDADGAQWETPLVVGTANSTESDLDLAVINTLPCIAYADYNQGLYLAVALDVYGSAWNEPVLIDAGDRVGKSVKMVEIDGRLALAYYNAGRQNIEFAVYRP